MYAFVIKREQLMIQTNFSNVKKVAKSISIILSGLPLTYCSLLLDTLARLTGYCNSCKHTTIPYSHRQLLLRWSQHLIMHDVLLCSITCSYISTQNIYIIIESLQSLCVHVTSKWLLRCEKTTKNVTIIIVIVCTCNPA